MSDRCSQGESQPDAGPLEHFVILGSSGCMRDSPGVGKVPEDETL